MNADISAGKPRMKAICANLKESRISQIQLGVVESLTLGFVKIKGSFKCEGTNSLTPSLGGSDWLLRWPWLCSLTFAGERIFLSCSGVNVTMVIKPTLLFWHLMGMRNLAVS